MEQPDFLKVVRMYRKERDWSYLRAKTEAIKIFDAKGWTHPFQERRQEVKSGS